VTPYILTTFDGVTKAEQKGFSTFSKERLAHFFYILLLLSFLVKRSTAAYFFLINKIVSEKNSRLNVPQPKSFLYFTGFAKKYANLSLIKKKK